MYSMEEAMEVLQTYFGYHTFREGQEVLVEKLLEGQDVIGIMPTGAGKSICYQVPALVFKGVTIVISPLISLMKDQVDTLKEMDIACGYLNSTQTNLEYKQTIQDVVDGKIKLLYVAPERLESADFLEITKHINIAFVAVDEAHCVSQWGHDFRPSYKGIATFINRLAKRPIVGAFTATATPRVKEDIIQLLTLQTPYTLTTGFDRSNLYFEVQKPHTKMNAVFTYLQDIGDESGIIYCNTRKNVDSVYEKLQQQGIKVSRYHAGLLEQERTMHQEDFLYDKTQIMVATNAFGMGIDKSNIRFVIHYNMPKTIENYYQEAGRCGRDGLPGACILLYSAQDIMTNRLLIESSQDTTDVQLEYEKLNQMVDYCNTESCLRHYILNYFGETLPQPCNHCYNCKSEVIRQDITIEAQKILSCIKRMGERFGSSMVIDVLRGSKARKIHEWRLDTLSTYGIMQETSKENLKDMIAYLVAEKYIDLKDSQYPTLSLAPQAYRVLKGEEQVKMRITLEKEPILPAFDASSYPVDRTLLAQLKDRRRAMAEEQGVPPFVVFSDATLHEMSQYYPMTKEEMLHISGVGEVKYDKYAHVFAQEIKDYAATNTINKPDLHILQQKRQNPKKTTTTAKATSNYEGDTYQVTYKMYQEGKSLEEIAKERGLNKTTIENHLVTGIMRGWAIDPYDFMTAEDEKLIEQAIKEVGGERLKPIKEQLPEHISYTAIKIVLEKIKQQSA